MSSRNSYNGQSGPERPAPPCNGRPRRSNPREPIMFEPTPEEQRMYNQMRREHELAQRTGLRDHDGAHPNSLRPPNSGPGPTRMSRSSTTGSGTSSYSGLGLGNDSGLRPPRVDIPKNAKKERGKRRGPLSDETKFVTHVRRKLKLVCLHHKEKRTTCTCFDLTNLELGYARSQELDGEISANGQQASQYENVSSEVGAAGDRTSNELFGMGQLPYILDIDGPADDALSNPQPAYLRPHVQRFASGFDLDSIHMNMVNIEDSFGQSYHPGENRTSLANLRPLTDRTPIGSEMNHNYWRCEYRTPASSIPELFPETCSWSGSYDELQSHYSTEHHLFEEAAVPHWCECHQCNAFVPGWEYPVSCPSLGCSQYQQSWKRWYYGCVRTASIPESNADLSLYTESEGGYYSSAHTPTSQLSPHPGSSMPDPWAGGGPGGGSSSYAYNSYSSKHCTSPGLDPIGRSLRFSGDSIPPLVCLPIIGTIQWCFARQNPAPTSEANEAGALAGVPQPQSFWVYLVVLLALLALVLVYMEDADAAAFVPQSAKAHWSLVIFSILAIPGFMVTAWLGRRRRKPAHCLHPHVPHALDHASWFPGHLRYLLLENSPNEPIQIATDSGKVEVGRSQPLTVLRVTDTYLD